MQDDTFERDEIYLLITKKDMASLLDRGEYIPPTSFICDYFGGVKIDLYEVFEEVLPDGF